MTDLPIEDGEGAIRDAYEGLVRGRGPVAESIANRRARRAARLVAVAARLEEELGSDAPELTAIRSRIERAEPARVALEQRAERERRRPTIEKDQWVVYGRVLNHDRTPAAGVRIRLFDKDRQFDDLLGETRADEYGDYLVGPYTDEDFLEAEDEPGNLQLPELYLKIYGARNKLVFDGSENARFQAGRVEYIEVVLPEPPSG
jgi:hypothetical protein